jgi:hypothetical protein
MGGTTVRRWHAGYGAQLPLTFTGSHETPLRGSLDDARSGTQAVELDWGNPAEAVAICEVRDMGCDIRRAIRASLEMWA